MSAQSYLLSPSNRLPTEEGESGGSHETNILVVTTPPSVRSSAAASRYSPCSTRSPFSFDPAPSPPLSPPVHCTSSSPTAVSSPLDRARHALRLSGENLTLKQQQKDLQLPQMQRETGYEENEDEDEHGQQQTQLQKLNVIQPLTTARTSAAVPPSPPTDVDNQRLSPHLPARPRPFTSGARVGGAAHEYSLADRGLVQVGTGGAVAASGATGVALPSPHIPEIRGESAATARVLLQVMRAGVFSV
jgi:hypothetical protein